MPVEGQAPLAHRRALSGLFRPVKPHRIVDQELALQRSCGRDVRDEIDQQAVVRHVVLQVGMRPVGAPEYAIGKVATMRRANGITSR